MNRRPISNQTWERIRPEFTLSALAQGRRRLAVLREDPEPVVRQLVLVFIGEGPFFPGFQFLPGGQLHPTGSNRRACPFGTAEKMIQCFKSRNTLR